MLAVTREAFGEFEEVEAEDEVDVGNPVPATMAILGICFMSCAVLLAGLPPLSGFVAKIAIITGLLQSTGTAVAGVTWSYMALLIVSGFATLIAMSRAGIRPLWGAEEGAVPRVKIGRASGRERVGQVG